MRRMVRGDALSRCRADIGQRDRTDRWQDVRMSELHRSRRLYADVKTRKWSGSEIIICANLRKSVDRYLRFSGSSRNVQAHYSFSHPVPAHHRRIPGCNAGEARLQEIGEVETFDYPYMREGRKRPDRLPQLIAAHRQALENARTKRGTEGPTFLIGKSMGGRIGCHLALEEKVDGLVCLGYPLCAMGDRDRAARRSSACVAHADSIRAGNTRCAVSARSARGVCVRK